MRVEERSSVMDVIFPTTGSADIKNGIPVIKAMEPMPYFGINENDVVPLYDDGKHICCGGLTWNREQLQSEIDRGLWKLFVVFQA